MSDFPFLFGVRGLDGLIHRQAVYTDEPKPDGSWSAALVGPDGCGKSLLALHLCSSYRMRFPCAQVMYVSTDLSFSQATRQWSSFGLEYPRRRLLTLCDAYAGVRSPQDYRVIPETPTLLSRVCPSSDERGGQPQTVSLDSIFQSRDVLFLDLQQDTVGDDWSFLNRLMGMLDPNAGDRHLLVIDAVEGLETMVGRTDAFGERRTRRSRVAQLVRAAARACCHLVFVIEQARKRRLPEQFVADLVILIHDRRASDYTVRYLEIEKCRAYEHALGRHELSVRSGRGAFTGSEFHLDQPHIPWPPSSSVGSAASTDASPRCLAHLHVTPSVHRVLSELRDERADWTHANGGPSFAMLRKLNALISLGRPRPTQSD